MKKTMKRYLSLLLAVMMIVSSFAFNISAADCAHETSDNPDFVKVINPTCTEQGYTIKYCIKCGQEVSRDNFKEALGHKYGEETFESNGKGAYRKYWTCINKYRQGDKTVVCGDKVIELEDGNEVVYYLVEFFNNKVVKTYDSSIDYTILAGEYKEVKLYETYVRAGTQAVYKGDRPSRIKTKNFGSYSFLGWTEKTDLDTTIDNNHTIKNECIDLYEINDNMKLYPVFEGKTDKYEVTFYTTDDKNNLKQLTNPQPVEHGKTPIYHNEKGELYDDPTKSTDLANSYVFNGWATKSNAKEGISTEVMLKTPIYGTVNYFATFKGIPLNYTIEFRGADGKNLLKYKVDGEEKDAIFNGQHFGSNLYSGDIKDALSYIEGDETALEKKGDATYVYKWNGKWRALDENGNPGQLVNLHSFSVEKPYIRYAVDENGDKIYIDGTDEQKKVIRLVPEYERRLVVYAVDVEMLVPTSEDDNYYRAGAEITITDREGQLVGSGYTNEYGKKRFYLNNRAPFTVTIATSDGKYVGVANFSQLNKALNGDENDEAQLNHWRVQMALNPDYETHCKCIHHNAFLQPILVRIYNILYTFFNYKYVCCYDMYSTIGPLLEYAQ